MNPLSSEFGRRHLEDICKIFREKPIVQRKAKFILFVCGGKIDPTGSSLRKEFLEWAQTELKEFICILAETALHDSFANEGREFVNLAAFETLIADVSDGVLIFPETPGSFAEVGYFSHSEVRKKTFVANLFRYQTAESFLKLGPIDTIDRYTFLKPVFLNQDTECRTDFKPVKDRLQQLITPPDYRPTLSFQKFSAFNFKEKLLVTFELLRILRLATLETLRYAIDKCFGSNPKQRDVRHLLRILLAANYVVRQGEYFFPVPGVLLVDIKNVEIESVLARSQFLYKKHFPEIFTELTAGVANAD
jgi:hypothetical protein